jgi:hypothetical protein
MAVQVRSPQIAAQLTHRVLIKQGSVLKFPADNTGHKAPADAVCL